MSGRPKWIEKRSVIRTVLKVLGLAAGMCMAAAGGAWAKMSPEDPWQKRILAVVLGILLGIALTGFLWWYIGAYY